MEKRNLIKMLGVLTGSGLVIGLCISCATTITPVIEEGYDWNNVKKICVVGISDLDGSREISKELTHQLFEKNFPVTRREARSVTEIYDIAKEADADVIAYGEVSRVELITSSANLSRTPTKEVEMNLHFIETATRKRIWQGSGTRADSANVKDEYIINELLGKMAKQILPQRAEAALAFKEANILQVGEEAPPFEVRDVNGNAYVLKDQLNKNIVVLSFWSFFCEPCRAEMRTLNDVYRRYHLRGVDVAAVSLEGEPMLTRIKSLIYQDRLEFVFLLDEPSGETYKVSDPYKVPGTPALYVIGKSGKIVFARAGEVTLEELSAVIESELTRGNQN